MYIPKDVGAGDDSSSSVEPGTGAGIVERSGFTVQLHIPRVDAWTEDPRIVQIILSGFD